MSDLPLKPRGAAVSLPGARILLRGSDRNAGRRLGLDVGLSALQSELEQKSRSDLSLRVEAFGCLHPPHQPNPASHSTQPLHRVTPRTPSHAHRHTHSVKLEVPTCKHNGEEKGAHSIGTAQSRRSHSRSRSRSTVTAQPRTATAQHSHSHQPADSPLRRPGPCCWNTPWQRDGRRGTVPGASLRSDLKRGLGDHWLEQAKVEIGASRHLQGGVAGGA